MPEIRLEHITKRWKNFYAVDDLDLVIADNAFVTLLIAGLETPTSGRITIGDRVVYDSALGINVPANKRKVGFLFQNYALWPNMTVYENISFGLSNIKESMPKIDFEAKNNARLAEILKNPADVRRVVEECRDKKGNLDEKKAVIKLIDEYTISQYTAKKLFAYHVEDGKDVSAAAAELAKKAADAVKANGLNEKYEYVKGGQGAASAASSRSACSWTATRRSYPAASSSVWPSPAPWPPSRRCCSWTSRCRTWTPNSVWRCATSCSVCMWRPAPPLSMSPTTRWRP